VISLKSDDQCLEAFCKEHCTTANEKFHKCQNIYETVQSRIEFAKRCETFGAEYLQYPHKQRIASACDKYENVYVLLDGQGDDETTTQNQSAFVELAKNSQLDSKTACYFTWTDCTGDVKIEHYRKNKRVHEDVAKELETKNNELHELVALLPSRSGNYFFLLATLNTTLVIDHKAVYSWKRAIFAPFMGDPVGILP